jgi:hypothetical protein
LELPTHCYSCGAYLMGGATTHEPGCEVQQLIDDALSDAATPPEEAGLHD